MTEDDWAALTVILLGIIIPFMLAPILALALNVGYRLLGL